MFSSQTSRTLVSRVGYLSNYGITKYQTISLINQSLKRFSSNTKTFISEHPRIPQFKWNIQTFSSAQDAVNNSSASSMTFLGIYKPKSDEAEPLSSIFGSEIGKKYGKVIPDYVLNINNKQISVTTLEVESNKQMLGKNEEIDSFVEKCISISKKNSLQSITICLPSSGDKTQDDIIKSTIFSIYDSFYSYKFFKSSKPNSTEENKPKLSKINIVLYDSSSTTSTTSSTTSSPSSASFKKIISSAEAISEGRWLARDMVNAPANKLTPSAIAELSKQISEKFPNLFKLRILEKDECEKRGMGAYLAVAQGSENPPKFVHLTYDCGQENVPEVTLIGKGLTFDSGGYNIKSSASSIELMKFDMGGAAAVLGTAQTLALLKPKSKVHFIIAACENMVSDRAIRPGDVVTASNGKTIEVDNTDAEGRLTLADALVYVEKETKSDVIVDIATLTGAVVVGLGEKVAAFYTTSGEMVDKIEKAAEKGNEHVWHMPLFKSYKNVFKSNIADMKNSGKARYGGSITAAMFLTDYVENEKWVHMDIAGTVWEDNKGATGFGVGTLTNLVNIVSEEKKTQK